MYATSVTLNWVPFTLGSGTGTAEGYVVQAATDTTFGFVQGSSTTADVTFSTLTITTGLNAGTTYFFRVGALNHDQVPSFTVEGGTRTLPGPAPINPQVLSVYVSSMVVTWTGVNPDSGYVLDASLAPDFSSIANSSITYSTSLTTMTGAPSLLSDTTYYLRVGSLWNGTTTYAAPLSTSTLTTNVTNAQF